MTEPQANSDPRRAVVAWLGSEHIVAEIRRALPDHIPVDWFMRLAQTSILMNPDLATSDRPSLLRELVAVAQLGLVLDPQMGEAWLIIDRHKNVQRRIGYQGLRKLALQSGLVTGLNSQAVYANDATEIELGDTPHVRHKINVNAEDRGKLLGCYAVGRVTGTDQPVVEWMSWKQIQAHRDRYSQAKSGPWSDPLAEIEMGRKTVFRRLCKWLPKSPLLADALAEEDRLDMRVVNPESAEPESQPQRSALSVIAGLNAPPVTQVDAGKGAATAERWGAEAQQRESREPITQTAQGAVPPPSASAAVPLNADAIEEAQRAAGYDKLHPPQDVGYAASSPAPVSSSPEPSPPTENAPTGQQSVFEVEIGGEVYRKPEDAVLALTLRIEQSIEPSMILDEYAVVMDNLPNKFANEVLAAISNRNNLLTRKHADAERERQTSAKPDQEQETRKRGPRSGREITDDLLADIASTNDDGELSEILATAQSFRRLTPEMRGEIQRAVAAKNRPPETVGEARSQEPAATPAPGRYTLRDTRGDLRYMEVNAGVFLEALHQGIDAATTEGEANAWRLRNKNELKRLAETEGGELADDALDLLS